ncbi:MAG: type IV pili methyl-accepting chemotaxis transducer N-terminal domain-containing protein [Gammaproteobacteria bacterium]|nr:type IV pili methyl-accepting chemotaxis transducer N-terminal domain-containing protein [Gammaproteobacteria bacterium]MBU1414101.1 type IV pili methyl-accepting chemotaxis transducer N-terminal domain-containing protein [Gammaproteobacteria bacterium]
MIDLLRKYIVNDDPKSLRVRVIGALVVIGVLILLSQVLLQWLLTGQQQAVHIVSVASQQRMLSQEIVKTGYRLIGVGSTEARHSALEELRMALAQFKRAHAGLQHGDEDLGLPGGNSPQIALLFATLDPEYQAMLDAGGAVLANVDRLAELHQAVQRLREHESAFLNGMGEIVSRYESEAGGSAGYARGLGLVFALVTLATLAFLARYVFLPVMVRLQRDARRHEGRENEMDKLFSVSPVALFLVEATSLVVERGNLKAEVLIGCSADDFTGRPLSTYFDARIEANKVLLQKIRTGGMFDELPVLMVDARQNAVDVLASMRRVTYLGMRHYLIAITDVTEIRRAGGK